MSEPAEMRQSELIAGQLRVLRLTKDIESKEQFIKQTKEQMNRLQESLRELEQAILNAEKAVLEDRDKLKEGKLQFELLKHRNDVVDKQTISPLIAVESTPAITKIVLKPSSKIDALWPAVRAKNFVRALGMKHLGYDSNIRILAQIASMDPQEFVLKMNPFRFIKDFMPQQKGHLGLLEYSDCRYLKSI